MCHCFCCCRYIFRKINWHILSGFFLLIFFGIFLAMVKTYANLVCHFFSFFVCLYHLPATCCLGFVLEKESCPLCSEFLTGLCYAYKLHADAFPVPLNFFSDRTRCDFVLSHCMQTLELVQTKTSMSSHSVRFSFGVLNLSSKV